ncbi:MAG: hypothetical protein KJ062_03440 [Thermoanaerobaculia bacterium]|nr:hypothetical protein [Thermoanaerobaculia bacterium]
MKSDPDTALEEVSVGKRRKRALRIDTGAEDSFAWKLARYLRGSCSRIEVLGEERLRSPDLNLAGRTGIVALVDAIDGTDLLERGLSNWCCASIFFRPAAAPGSRILAAFAGLPDGSVYFATADTDGARVARGPSSQEEGVRGPSRVRRLAMASVYFYGQKLGNLRAVSDDGFLDRMARACEQVRKPRLRIYNLAGTPMMVRMTDHRIRDAGGIDAVFDLSGQQPHDVVPGAFIAKKAGATLVGLDGAAISFERLEELLLEPAKERLRYVLAATPALASELLACVSAPSEKRSAGAARKAQRGYRSEGASPAKPPARRLAR